MGNILEREVDHRIGIDNKIRTNLDIFDIGDGPYHKFRPYCGDSWCILFPTQSREHHIFFQESLSKTIDFN